MKQVALIALIMLLISNCVAVYSTPRTDEAFWAVTAKNATDIAALAKEDTSGDAEYDLCSDECLRCVLCTCSNQARFVFI